MLRMCERKISRGFTLVELLVVIAIIGILAGIMIASFGGATESARASQCLSNLKSLAQAANSFAVHNGSSAYPCAGSLERFHLRSSGVVYLPNEGWISWLDNKDQYVADESDDDFRYAKSHQNIETANYAGMKDEDVKHALENGVLWKMVGGNRSVYTCPVHVNYRRKHGLPTPAWSYVMNARFGWDNSLGAKPVLSGKSYGYVPYGKVARADRVLMFAELPTVDPKTGQPVDDGKGTALDSVLQYQNTKSKGTESKAGSFSSENASEAESIGFVHTGKRGIRYAHVAFADGHTEKLQYGESGADTKALTTYLCRGWEVVFENNGWKLADHADEVDD